MLVLLPPSETKAAGTRGRPLDLGALSFPSLHRTREVLAGALSQLAVERPEELQQALGLSSGQQQELARNAALLTAPTLPTLRVYRGIVYDNLDYASLTGPALRRANRSLVVCSALFGLLRPGDRVPPYRLSGQTVLPGLGGLAPLWRPVLEPLLARERFVVDLRSGAYAALARVPGSVQVRVLRAEGGRLSVVSHDNKWTKGLLARALCVEGASSVADVAEVGRTVCDDVVIEGNRVDLLLHGLASARG